MHDAQKNFLVFGLSDAEDFANLPVHGHTDSYSYGWGTVWNLLPAVLVVLGLWLWIRKPPRAEGMQKAVFFSRNNVVAFVLGGLGLFLLVRAWPLSEPQFSAYDSSLGYRPYQAFINAVEEQGGMAFWSMPETRNDQVYPIGPLGQITIKTDPQPEALLLTEGYTGFGGIYQDTRTATKPGGIWDQALNQYLQRQRLKPPFVVGEIAFHGPEQAGKQFNQVLTVFWVQERTAAGVVGALRNGHYYAVEQVPNKYGLRLNAFKVGCEGSVRWAISGEAMKLGANCRPLVKVSVSATDQKSHSISVRIIRSGNVVASLNGETPYSYRFVDNTVPRGQPIYYRVEVLGGGEILSNPIFVYL